MQYLYPPISQNIWTLKIRWSGEEDDIILCNTEQQAHREVRNYFSFWHRDKVEQFKDKSIDELEEYFSYNDIGYFDILLLNVINEQPPEVINESR